MYNRYIPQPDGSYRRSSLPDGPSPSGPAQQRPGSRPAPNHSEEPVKEHQPAHEDQAARKQESVTHPPCPRSRQRSGPSMHRPPQKPQPPPAAKYPDPGSGPKDTSVSSFLRQLLPKDFDTGDLLVVILLLLMAGDCKEDQNSALLTLVLYLFM